MENWSKNKYKYNEDVRDWKNEASAFSRCQQAGVISEEVKITLLLIALLPCGLQGNKAFICLGKDVSQTLGMESFTHLGWTGKSGLQCGFHRGESWCFLDFAQFAPQRVLSCSLMCLRSKIG